MNIEIDRLSFSYGAAEVLHDLSFSASDGDLVAVLGPNGVGKSTLFRCMLGFLRPSAGAVLLDGKNIRGFDHKEIAQRIAYIPQSVSPAFNYTVLDTVLMGVTSRLGLFESPGPEHRAQAMEILDSLGIADLANRGCGKISGGEKQLVLLARALIQNAKILIMDEPTAALDYGNSFRVMRRIEALGNSGFTVIFSTHEPNHAFRYANRVLAMKAGSLLAEGAPNEVLTEETLSALYGIDVAVRGVALDDTEYMLSIPKRER